MAPECRRERRLITKCRRVFANPVHLTVERPCLRSVTDCPLSHSPQVTHREWVLRRTRDTYWQAGLWFRKGSARAESLGAVRPDTARRFEPRGSSSFFREIVLRIASSPATAQGSGRPPKISPRTCELLRGFLHNEISDDPLDRGPAVPGTSRALRLPAAGPPAPEKEGLNRRF